MAVSLRERFSVPHRSRPYPCTENPDGWFAVALSHEVVPGQVKAVSCLGRELVVFRTATGQVAVTDAHCPHMGAHLGHGGLVREECLVCPFHNWAFGVDGACAAIPYAKKIPPRARVRTYPVRERNGAILLWHHHAGAGPDFEIPELPATGWSEVRWTTFELDMHIIEIAENGVDSAHFLVVHHTGRGGHLLQDVVGPPFRFQLYTSYPGDGLGLPGTFVSVTTDWDLYCPGFFVASSTADDFGTRARQIYHFTPVPGGRIVCRVGIAVDVSTVPSALHELVVEKNAELTRRNFEEDQPIWKHKVYLEDPVLCEGDRGLAPLRAYFRRFYPELAGAGAPPRPKTFARHMLMRNAEAPDVVPPEDGEPAT
jgi:3-ketosteroid 9alpha-monooxygenase subunit A